MKASILLLCMLLFFVVGCGDKNNIPIISEKSNYSVKIICPKCGATVTITSYGDFLPIEKVFIEKAERR